MRDVLKQVRACMALHQDHKDSACAAAVAGHLLLLLLLKAQHQGATAIESPHKQRGS